MANSQIPLHHDLLGYDNKMSQPWAFWFENFTSNLPPSGSGFVVDGTKATYGTTTFYQGFDINKGASPNLGDVYFAVDTGKIYVEQSGEWVLQVPAYTGDATSLPNSNNLTLATVNPNTGTWGSSTSIPVITVNGKGLVTAVWEEVVQSPAGGLTGSVQYNVDGIINGDEVFLYDPDTLLVSLFDLFVDNEITFTDPTATRTNLLPDQTNNEGKVLTSDGTDVYWGDGGDSEFPFNYGDATPKPLFTVDADKIIEEVIIIIMEAFDAASSLEVGSAADPDELFTSSDINTLETGTYSVQPAFKYGVATALDLTITAGASTQGSGLVKIIYQK